MKLRTVHVFGRSQHDARWSQVRYGFRVCLGYNRALIVMFNPLSPPLSADASVRYGFRVCLGPDYDTSSSFPYPQCRCKQVLFEFYVEE
jgi:hypothetical protein